ncbi:MAG: hypothetical protein M0D54_17130 [Hyphomonadaceae bacterium JAD_PAG50586_4]|nr:MAG: hypothetical protein M0D54_17130 [Hyphomonadaceae bacterium JAD_PAG50586_4]
MGDVRGLPIAAYLGALVALALAAAFVATLAIVIFLPPRPPDVMRADKITDHFEAGYDYMLAAGRPMNEDGVTWVVRDEPPRETHSVHVRPATAQLAIALELRPEQVRLYAQHVERNESIVFRVANMDELTRDAEVAAAEAERIRAEMDSAEYQHEHEAEQAERRVEAAEREAERRADAIERAVERAQDAAERAAEARAAAAEALAERHAEQAERMAERLAAEAERRAELAERRAEAMGEHGDHVVHIEPPDVPDIPEIREVLVIAPPNVGPDASPAPSPPAAPEAPAAPRARTNTRAWPTTPAPPLPPTPIFAPAPEGWCCSLGSKLAPNCRTVAGW